MNAAVAAHAQNMKNPNRKAQRIPNPNRSAAESDSIMNIYESALGWDDLYGRVGSQENWKNPP